LNLLKDSIDGCHVYPNKRTNGLAIKSYLDTVAIGVTVYTEKDLFLAALQANYKKPPLFITDLKTAEENFTLFSSCPYPILITATALLQKRAYSELLTSPNLSYIRVPLRRSQLYMGIQSLFASIIKKDPRKRVKTGIFFSN
jgi:hypothetical protein